MNLHTSLLTLVLALSASAALANPKLHGTWQSHNAEGNALHGVIELRKDGTARLAPAGHDELNGTWTASGDKLTLTMPPHGTTSMEWATTKKGLTLTYENGVKQDFLKKEKNENKKLDAGKSGNK